MASGKYKYICFPALTGLLLAFLQGSPAAFHTLSCIRDEGVLVKDIIIPWLSGSLEIAPSIRTTSIFDFEAATCLIYMLPENICGDLTRERKQQVSPILLTFLAKKLLEKATQLFLNKNGFVFEKPT